MKRFGMRVGSWLMGMVALASVGVGVTAGTAGIARAGMSCGEAGMDGAMSCEVGVASRALDVTVADVGGQRMSQWCWAASIAMVFRYYGYEVSQQRIVAETFGVVTNMPGTSEQILRNLDRVWTDDRGRRFRVSADAYSASSQTAAADLADDRPLIIGTMGHAMVLTALGYMTNSLGEGWVTHAVVRDPWPGQGRRELAAEEWSGLDLLVRVSVTPLR